MEKVEKEGSATKKKIILDLKYQKCGPMEAWLDGRPELKGRGYYPREAIGNLMLEHGREIGIEVETTEGMKAPFPAVYYEPGVGG